MVKVKRKVEMNLPQLIEWAWENNVKEETFYDYENRVKRVYFNALGYAEFSDVHQFSSYDTFIFEVEEEINEYTVFPKIAELNLCGYDQHEELFMNENKSVKELLSEEETNNKALYIVNDDYSMTLIWKNGKLVE